MYQSLHQIETSLKEIKESIKDSSKAIMLSAILQSQYSSSSDKERAIRMMMRELKMNDGDN